MNAWEGKAAHPVLPAGDAGEKRVTGVFLPVTIHHIALICE
jgi:hypothetical protein